MKIPAAKAAVDKEWEKLEKFSAWNLTKIKSKKQVIDEAKTFFFFFRARGQLISRSECSYNHLGSCPSKSARKGVAPPVQQTVSHCATGSTRDAAKLVAQTVDNNRRSHARETHLAMYAGTSLALATESCRKSCTPSSAQRPPVSMPRTTSLQRPAVSSGYVLSLSLFELGTTLPHLCPQRWGALRPHSSMGIAM